MSRSAADGSLVRPPVSFAHLFRLSDRGGLFEHARFAEPRPEHGYCIDDIARGLVVLAREPQPSEQLAPLSDFYLWLVTDAQAADGRFHNRRDLDLRWIDEPSLDDCWGRALWGLGTAAARLPQDSVAAGLAMAHFDLSAARRSPHLHAMAFAALGAAEVLTRHPDHAGARRLLGDAAALIAGAGATNRRLAVARAPAALRQRGVAGGAAGRRVAARRHGLAGTRARHARLAARTSRPRATTCPSPRSAAGSPANPGPAFDQQPIEVAALADACARGVHRHRGSALADRPATAARPGSSAPTTPASAWSIPITGGCCDGLHRTGRNENQGAESTLAMISTFQQSPCQSRPDDPGSSPAGVARPAGPTPAG